MRPRSWEPLTSLDGDWNIFMVNVQICIISKKKGDYAERMYPLWREEGIREIC